MTNLMGNDRIPHADTLGVSTVVENGQLSEEQVAYFLEQFKGCPEQDIAGFFWTVEHYKFNPFGQAQIHGIPRNVRAKNGERWETQKRLTVQIGINGQVKIAQSTNRYAGMTEPYWCGDDEVWRRIWNRARFVDAKDSWGKAIRALEIEAPAAAKVGVSVVGVAVPSWGVANWYESADFDPQGEPRNLWKTKPALMLAKTAASLALRRTFQDEFESLRGQLRNPVEFTTLDERPEPDVVDEVISEITAPRRAALGAPRARISDLYDTGSDAEPEPAAQSAPMPEADAIPRKAPAAKQPEGEPLISKAQMNHLHGVAERLHGFDHQAVHDLAVRRYACGVGELTVAQASDFIDLLNKAETAALFALPSAEIQTGETPYVPDGAPVDAATAAAWEAVGASPAGDVVDGRKGRR